MMFRFQPKFFSIQLTLNSMRLIVLRSGRIRHFAQFTSDTPFLKDGVWQKQTAQDFLKEKLATIAGLHGNTVALSLPEDKTFTKVLTLNKKIDLGNEKDILTEIEQYIPVPIQDVYADWQMVSSGIDRTAIAFTASEKKFVDDLLSIFSQLDLQVLALEPESHSLVRALLPEHARSEAVCLLEIEETHSTCVVQEGGVIYFSRRVPNGSWQNLCRSVRESCQFFTSHISPAQRPVDHILLCGIRTPTDGDSLQQIAKLLKYPVFLAQPWGKRKPPASLKNDVTAYAFSVALGLSLRT